jgi:metal-responsive CopG/Arc/MetJ family transcriptional regulator
MKVAISVPDPVFKAAEQLARQRKVSRSQLYSEALSAYLGSRGATEVTAKLNAIYGAESSDLGDVLTHAQLRSVAHEAW